VDFLPLKTLEKYNLVWNSPSVDPRDSMPLGNGDIGVNVWVEKSGEILLYVGKSDAWDGYSRLLKIGRIRVKFSPNPLTDIEHFGQKLDLVSGEVTVKFGQKPNSTLVRIWVDDSTHREICGGDAQTRLE
jgi:alpha-L-fucosidase 2